MFDATQSVGAIVRNFPSAIRVFEQFGIDYCCGGHNTLEQACAQRLLPVDDVLRKLHEIELKAPRSPARSTSLSDLISLIVSTHHEFAKQEAPRMVALARKVHKAHGKRHPELEQVQHHVDALFADLMPHMEKEERVLFPYLLALEAGEPCSPPTANLASIEPPIRAMEHEHERVGSILRALQTTTANYQLPEDSCGSFRALYVGLQELEADLHQHIHLENNMLFQQARERARGSQ